jgi:iron(III) transport system substrate-binding protein
LRGRVGTYDVRQSGLGYLLATQDARLTPLSAALAAAMGDNDVVLAAETRTLLQRLAAGELALAYNVLGSYARARIAAGDPLQLVQLEDYTLVVARIALIPKSAPHVAAAHRFLDYLLSERGQRLLARGGLPPLAGEHGRGAEIAAQRPVPLGPGLLVYRDARKRHAFLEGWTQSIRPRDTR